MDHILPLHLFVTSNNASTKLGRHLPSLKHGEDNLMVTQRQFQQLFLWIRGNWCLKHDTGTGKTTNSGAAVSATFNFAEKSNTGSLISNLLSSKRGSNSILFLAKSNDILGRFRHDLLINVNKFKTMTFEDTGAKINTRQINLALDTIDTRFHFFTYGTFFNIVQYNATLYYFGDSTQKDGFKKISAKYIKVANKLKLEKSLIVCDEIQHLLTPDTDPEDEGADAEEITLLLNKFIFNPEYPDNKINIKNLKHLRKTIQGMDDPVLIQQYLDSGKWFDLKRLATYILKIMEASPNSHKKSYYAIMLCKIIFRSNVLLLSATPLRSHPKTISKLSNLMSDYRRLILEKDIESNRFYDKANLCITRNAGSLINDSIPEENALLNDYESELGFEDCEAYCGDFNKVLPESIQSGLLKELKPFFHSVSHLKSNTGIKMRMLSSPNFSADNPDINYFDINNLPTVLTYAFFPNGIDTYQGYRLKEVSQQSGRKTFMIPHRQHAIVSTSILPNSKIDPMFLFSYSTNTAAHLNYLYNHNPKRKMKGLQYTEYVEKGVRPLTKLLESCGWGFFNPVSDNFDSGGLNMQRYEIENAYNEEDNDTNRDIDSTELEEDNSDEDSDDEDEVQKKVVETKKVVVKQSLYDNLTSFTQGSVKFTIPKEDRISHGDFDSHLHVQALRDAFNHADNWNGDYLFYMLISSKLSEGVDMKDTESIMLNVFYIYYMFIQLVGRIDRYRAHDALRKMIKLIYPSEKGTPKGNIKLVSNLVCELTPIAAVIDADEWEVHKFANKYFNVNSISYDPKNYYTSILRIKENLKILLYEYVSDEDIVYILEDESGRTMSRVNDVKGNNTIHSDHLRHHISQAPHILEYFRENIEESPNLFRDEFFSLGSKYKLCKNFPLKYRDEESVYSDTIYEILTGNIDAPLNVQYILAYWFIEIREIKLFETPASIKSYGLNLESHSYQQPLDKITQRLRVNQQEAYWLREVLSKLAVDAPFNDPTLKPEQIDANNYINNIVFIREYLPDYFDTLTDRIAKWIGKSYKPRPIVFKKYLKIIKAEFPRLQYVLDILTTSGKPTDRILNEWFKHLDNYPVDNINMERLRITKNYVGVYDKGVSISDHDLLSYKTSQSKINIHLNTDELVRNLADPVEFDITNAYVGYEYLLNSQLETLFKDSIFELCLIFSLDQNYFLPILEKHSVDTANVIETILNKYMYFDMRKIEQVPSSIIYRIMYNFSIINYVKSSVMFIFLKDDETGEEVTDKLFLCNDDKSLIDLFYYMYEVMGKDRDSNYKMVVVSKIKNSHGRSMFKSYVSDIDKMLVIDFNVIEDALLSYASQDEDDDTLGYVGLKNYEERVKNGQYSKSYLSLDSVIDKLEKDQRRSNPFMAMQLQYMDIYIKSKVHSRDLVYDFQSYFTKEKLLQYFEIYYTLIRIYYNISLTKNMKYNRNLLNYTNVIHKKYKIPKDVIAEIVPLTHIYDTEKFIRLEKASKLNYEEQDYQIEFDELAFPDKATSVIPGFITQNKINKIITTIKSTSKWLSSTTFLQPNKRGILISGIPITELANILTLYIVEFKRLDELRTNSTKFQKHNYLYESVVRRIPTNMYIEFEDSDGTMKQLKLGNNYKESTVKRYLNKKSSTYDWFLTKKTIYINGLKVRVKDVSTLLLNLSILLERNYVITPNKKNSYILDDMLNASGYINKQTKDMIKVSKGYDETGTYGTIYLLFREDDEEDDKPFVYYEKKAIDDLIDNNDLDYIEFVSFKYKYNKVNVVIYAEVDTSDEDMYDYRLTRSRYKKMFSDYTETLFDHIRGINLDMIPFDPFLMPSKT